MAAACTRKWRKERKIPSEALIIAIFPTCLKEEVEEIRKKKTHRNLASTLGAVGENFPKGEMKISELRKSCRATRSVLPSKEP